jgi:pyrimidine deaminase RibD-like protein
MQEEDRSYMRHALERARQGLGKTHPNPAVGCVIVKEGKVTRTDLNLPLFLCLLHTFHGRVI